jgi:hypothetical protein
LIDTTQPAKVTDDDDDLLAQARAVRGEVNSENEDLEKPQALVQ